jgi:hypothetical protein
MRKIKVLTTISLLFLATALNAQKAEIRGYLALWGELGYTGINHDIKKDDGLPKAPSPLSGYGAGLGVGYEFHYNAFIAKIGAEGNYWDAGYAPKDIYVEADVMDTEGEPYLGKFDLRNNSDRYQLGYVNFPLFVGFHLSNKLYFLVGAKYGLNVYGQSNVKSQVRSVAAYPQFIDEFGNMPNHYLYTVDRKKSLPITFENNLAASAEFGFYLTPSYNMNRTYRIAVFADYGFLNIHKNAINQEGGLVQNHALYSKDPLRWSAYEPMVNPIMTQGRAYNRTFTPMFIGAKFTILFKLHENSICICEWD